LNIASFIARRLVFRKNTSFSGFIVRLSVVATAISVAVMVVTLGFVAGFQDAIAKKVFSFWGHIRVHSQVGGEALSGEEIPMDYNDSIRNRLKSTDQVLYVDPYITKSAMLKSAESIEGVLLKGVTSDFSKQRIMPFIKKGGFLNFDTVSPSILISQYTARQLQVDTGSKVFLYFVSEQSETPRIRPVRVAGIYATGIEEYDKSFVLTEISLIRNVNKWRDDQAGGFEITLKNQERVEEATSAILDQIPVSWYASSVREMLPNIFDWLQLQNTNRRLIIAVMCIVAMVNLISCLLILVLERTKMIGLLKALGATNTQVQKIFLRKGLMIAIMGVVLGTLAGLGFSFLQQYFGFIRLDESAYYIDVAPVKIIWWQVLFVQIGTFLVAFLILFIPSLLVRTIRPVTALRFD
jgi:lipoprotein-releasing system permease protein